MASKVKQWRSQGVPIDGIGSQAHIQPGQGPRVHEALQLLCGAAPECALTEIDMKGANPSDYSATIKACVGIKNCVGVTVWGVSDKDSWHKGDRPLMWDDGFKPKPALNAVKQALA